jgi:SAM-dependent methyltransferase
MRPADVALEQVHRWIAPLLEGRSRVLEVGCGTGDLARRLASDGHQVTAIDLELDHPAAAAGIRWVEGDFLAFDDGRFDAVLFTRSLHHIDPLEQAVDHAARLLSPAGLLVVDEFDRAAADRDTVRWYYDVQELLAAAAVYPADRIAGAPADDPAARWRDEHDHDPPLHGGAEMLAAIADRFARLDTARGPYLYRTIAQRVEDSARGAAVARQVLAAETRRLEAGALAAIGLRITATLP